MTSNILQLQTFEKSDYFQDITHSKFHLCRYIYWKTHITSQTPNTLQHIKSIDLELGIDFYFVFFFLIFCTVKSLQHKQQPP